MKEEPVVVAGGIKGEPGKEKCPRRTFSVIHIHWSSALLLVGILGGPGLRT